MIKGHSPHFKKQNTDAAFHIDGSFLSSYRTTLRWPPLSSWRFSKVFLSFQECHQVMLHLEEIGELLKWDPFRSTEAGEPGPGEDNVCAAGCSAIRQSIAQEYRTVALVLGKQHISRLVVPPFRFVQELQGPPPALDLK